jgi:hypothetical protein
MAASSSAVGHAMGLNFFQDAMNFNRNVMYVVRNGSLGEPKVHILTDVPDYTFITAPERRQRQGRLFLGSKLPRAWLFQDNLYFVHLQPRIHNC